MIPKKLFRVAAGVLLLGLGGSPLFGQAILTIASIPRTAADIGVTELSGQMVIGVVSGTTVSQQLLIQYSTHITNNAAREISITGTGGLAGAYVPVLVAGGDGLILDVPGGGGLGDAITIRGVRLAIAGQNLTHVIATVSSLSSSGNGFTAGHNTATVISDIQSPFSVDYGESKPLSFTNGKVTNGTTAFDIAPNYTGAFTDAVGVFGQTVSTRIRIIPFPSIPAGVKCVFPGRVTAESGAVLTTTSGDDETIPRDDGTTSVTYIFTSAPVFTDAPDSFQVSVTMTEIPTSGTGTISFQAALFPIGIATPNENFPSTDIPRYWENELPNASDLPGLSGTTMLAFPFRALVDATYTGIALTNPLDLAVKVTLTPFDAAGSAIAQPVLLTIPPKGQMAKLATDPGLFGPGFNMLSFGTILAVAKAPVMPGFYLLGDDQGSRLDGATAYAGTLQKWVWPVVFRQASAPFTVFELFNPNTTSADAAMTLYDASGAPISTASLSIASNGTMNRRLQELFPGVVLDSFAGGYIAGQSGLPLVIRETFGNSLDSNVLPGQQPLQLSTFYLPHFASGGGYTSELTLVNTDVNVVANLTVTLFDNNGATLGNPAKISIQPGAQAIQTIASLFPSLGATLATGSIRVDVAPFLVGWFSETPAVVGSVRFSAANGSGSAALPLSIPPASDFVFSHVAENAGYYTGVAILNTNPSAAASISLEVFNNSGIRIGTYSTTLNPGQKMAKLIHELVPASAGQSGGYIHILSSVPVTSFSLFGSLDGLSLSAIPAQNIGN
ncbi:MAG: hypothetical protein LAP85_19170 [Acidobacteriia bacterium]|nr:hypothetical protein [Terriglobia bacterium]